MLKIYLVRHAQSVANKGGITVGGDKDVELSEEGINQADLLVRYFKGKKVKSVYCSDLSRASATAKTIADALDIPCVEDSNLRELKIGEWSGTPNPLEKWIKYYEDEKRKGRHREEIRPTGGENSWDHLRRISLFLDSVKSEWGEIIVIGHSGTNKVFIGLINKTDPNEFYTFKQDNACINEIEFDGGNWKVLSINDTSHLKDGT